MSICKVPKTKSQHMWGGVKNPSPTLPLSAAITNCSNFKFLKGSPQLFLISMETFFGARTIQFGREMFLDDAQKDLISTKVKAGDLRKVGERQRVSFFSRTLWGTICTRGAFEFDSQELLKTPYFILREMAQPIILASRKLNLLHHNNIESWILTMVSSEWENLQLLTNKDKLDALMLQVWGSRQ